MYNQDFNADKMQDAVSDISSHLPRAVSTFGDEYSLIGEDDMLHLTAMGNITPEDGEEYRGGFGLYGDGEILEIWGFGGIVPYLDKMCYCLMYLDDRGLPVVVNRDDSQKRYMVHIQLSQSCVMPNSTYPCDEWDTVINTLWEIESDLDTDDNDLRRALENGEVEPNSVIAISDSEVVSVVEVSESEYIEHVYGQYL